MNKGQKELLEKAIRLHYGDKIPLFAGLYIIPQRNLHDSGYRCMYVIGHTPYYKNKKDWDYYLIGTYSDVIDLFGPGFALPIGCDLHMDINRHGIIHIWSNTEKKRFRCAIPFVSNCVMEIVDEL